MLLAKVIVLAKVCLKQWDASSKANDFGIE